MREAIFEVQVLLALERAAAPHGVELRVPRCISYKVHWRILQKPGGLVSKIEMVPKTIKNLCDLKLNLKDLERQSQDWKNLNKN